MTLLRRCPKPPRPSALPIAALTGLLVFLALTCQTQFTGMALRAAEVYRAAAAWHGLPAGVDNAFQGDLRMMREWMRQHGDEEHISAGRGRGIVVPAGGAGQMANAFVNLHVLRHHLGCTLPVTLAHWGASTRERLDPATLALFEEHLPGVKFLDLAELPYPEHHRWLGPPAPDAFNGFKVKVFALYAAPYSEVLMLDSDSMALMDPSLMFDLPVYLRHGNVFWPDRWCTPVPLHARLGVDDGGGERSQAESGQFLFDRARHACVLDWLLFLNTHDEWTYRYAHGDKDTYRAAFHLAGRGEEYYQVPQPLSLPLAPGGVMGPQSRGFVQHHPNGSLAFLHRTSHAKYSARSGAGRPIALLLLQPSCHWSEANWHFFSPPASALRRGVVRASRCNFTLYEPAAVGAECEARGGGRPPRILEVVPESYVGRAQAAADAAHAAYWAHVQSTSPSPQGPARRSAAALSVLFVLAAAAAALATAVMRPRWRCREPYLPDSLSRSR